MSRVPAWCEEVWGTAEVVMQSRLRTWAAGSRGARIAGEGSSRMRLFDLRCRPTELLELSLGICELGLQCAYGLTHALHFVVLGV